MTLQQRYKDLTESLTAFGKTYSPAIQAPLTVEKLTDYANTAIASKMPMMVGIGKEMKANISRANYSLTGNIY